MVPFLLLALWAPEQMELGAAARRAVEAYVTSLEALERREPDVTVERVFADALALRALALPPQGTGGLEEISADDFRALVRQLRGILVSRDEFVYAEADINFFAALARKFGGPPDEAFFAEYRRMFPANFWPSYVRQQTDESGCVEFGLGEIVARYRGWRDFAGRFPRAYRAQLSDLTADLESELTETTCACGDADSVLRELREFQGAFPGSRIGSLVRQRIDDIEQHRSNMRFNCGSQ